MKVRMTPRNTEPENHFVSRLKDKLLDNGVEVTYPEFSKDDKGRRWFDVGYENALIATAGTYTKNWNQQIIITIKQTNA